MAYSESHDLVAAGDTIGNVFSWKVGEVAATNTDEGDTPPHHAFGPPFHPKRCAPRLPFAWPSGWEGGHE